MPGSKKGPKGPSVKIIFSDDQEKTVIEDLSEFLGKFNKEKKDDITISDLLNAIFFYKTSANISLPEVITLTTPMMTDDTLARLLNLHRTTSNRLTDPTSITIKITSGNLKSPENIPVQNELLANIQALRELEKSLRQTPSNKENPRKQAAASQETNSKFPIPTASQTLRDEIEREQNIGPKIIKILAGVNQELKSNQDFPICHILISLSKDTPELYKKFGTANTGLLPDLVSEQSNKQEEIKNLGRKIEDEITLLQGKLTLLLQNIPSQKNTENSQRIENLKNACQAIQNQLDLFKQRRESSDLIKEIRDTAGKLSQEKNPAGATSSSAMIQENSRRLREKTDLTRSATSEPPFFHRPPQTPTQEKQEEADLSDSEITLLREPNAAAAAAGSSAAPNEAATAGSSEPATPRSRRNSSAEDDTSSGRRAGTQPLILEKQAVTPTTATAAVVGSETPSPAPEEEEENENLIRTETPPSTSTAGSAAAGSNAAPNEAAAATQEKAEKEEREEADSDSEETLLRQSNAPAAITPPATSPTTPRVSRASSIGGEEKNLLVPGPPSTLRTVGSSAETDEAAATAAEVKPPTMGKASSSASATPNRAWKMLIGAASAFANIITLPGSPYSKVPGSKKEAQGKANSNAVGPQPATSSSNNVAVAEPSSPPPEKEDASDADPSNSKRALLPRQNAAAAVAATPTGGAGDSSAATVTTTPQQQTEANSAEPTEHEAAVAAAAAAASEATSSSAEPVTPLQTPNIAGAGSSAAAAASSSYTGAAASLLSPALLTGAGARTAATPPPSALLTTAATAVHQTGQSASFVTAAAEPAIEYTGENVFRFAEEIRNKLKKEPTSLTTNDLFHYASKTDTTTKWLCKHYLSWAQNINFFNLSIPLQVQTVESTLFKNWVEKKYKEKSLPSLNLQQFDDAWKKATPDKREVIIGQWLRETIISKHEQLFPQESQTQHQASRPSQ